MYRNIYDLGLATTVLFLSHTTGLPGIRPDSDVLLSLIFCTEAAHGSCICRTEIHYDKYYTHKDQRYSPCSKHITNQVEIRDQDKYCSVIHLDSLLFLKPAFIKEQKTLLRIGLNINLRTHDPF